MARESDASGRVLFDGSIDLGAGFSIGDAGQPAFAAPWVNDVGTYKAGYQKMGGLVFVWGVVRNGNINTVIFTLPAGFRPGTDLRLPAWDATTNAATSVSVMATGDVVSRAANGDTLHIALGFLGA